MQLKTIGLIGYGEVGKIFSAGLQARQGVVAMAAWDLKFASAALGAQEAGTRSASGCYRAHVSARPV